jgi:hypothetical protein
MLAFAAVACGGGGSTGGTGQTFSVGGTVSGLTGAGLIVTNNGSDDHSITANGAFTFGTQLGTGTSYTVAVKTHPTGQTCSVANGSGTIANAQVTNVQITCGGSSSSLTGTWTTTGLGGIPGTVTMTFDADSGYTVDAQATAGVDVTGTYSLTGSRIVYTDSSGPQACNAATTGTYDYVISGTTLTFTLVSDPCNGRILAMSKTWTRQ